MNATGLEEDGERVVGWIKANRVSWKQRGLFESKIERKEVGSAGG